MEILIDDETVTTWTSSGVTYNFERIDLSGESGQVLKIRGELSSPDMWLSIIEVSVTVSHNNHQLHGHHFKQQMLKVCHSLHVVRRM